METKTINLAEVVRRDVIELNLGAHDKADAISRMTRLLATAGYVSDAVGFQRDVEYRETLGPTGVGNGIAIPHGKSKDVVRTTIAVGRTAPPVEWESLDDQPVDTIIMFAVQERDAKDVHLKLLQRVAVLLMRQPFVDALKAATTSKQIVDLLADNTSD